MRWEFATAARIVFGCGAVKEAAAGAREFGGRTLLVTGLSLERAAPVTDALSAAKVDYVVFPVEGEPTLERVREGSAAAHENDCEVIVSCGGGSAIDCGKAVAAMAANGGDPLDYLEVIGAGRPLRAPSLPFIAVPTTAGTGTEVTRNAVLASPEHRVKASLRSPLMLPRMAVIDPELTFELPPALTASTGLDALTQLIEPYVSARANALVDLYCVEGMRRAAAALPRAWADGGDREARIDMAFASLLGGFSLANAGLGVVHGFAAPVGGMFPAPHGAVCAALLPHGMEANIRALRARAPQSPVLARYQTIAGVLTGDAGARPEDGVEWVRALCDRLRIPPLREYGVTPDDAPVLVANAAQASSMKANPITLTAEELHKVLQGAMG